MKIRIKKGSIVFEAPKADLMSVNSTWDGIVFSFRGGIDLVYTNADFPNTSKDLIVNSCNSFQKAELTVDLDNPLHPVKASIS